MATSAFMESVTVSREQGIELVQPV